MVTGPLRNASPAALAASTTARPVPAHWSRAAWIRVVSGGLASWAALNVPVLVVSVAGSVRQGRGSRGRRGRRGSPVAILG
jgi:hypothetical protein